MIPPSSITIIASGTVSRIELRCASRAMQIAHAGRRLHACPAEPLADGGRTDSHAGEDEGIPDVGAADLVRRERQAHGDAQQRREQARAEAAEGAGDEHCRHREGVGTAALKIGPGRHADGKGGGDREHGDEVAEDDGMLVGAVRHAVGRAGSRCQFRHVAEGALSDRGSNSRNSRVGQHLAAGRLRCLLRENT